jgi:hypothetical protein
VAGTVLYSILYGNQDLTSYFGFKKLLRERQGFDLWISLRVFKTEGMCWISTGLLPHFSPHSAPTNLISGKRKPIHSHIQYQYFPSIFPRENILLLEPAVLAERKAAAQLARDSEPLLHKELKNWIKN